MNPSRYFLLPDGRLRAGWRLLLFLIFCAVALSLSAWLLRGIPIRRALPAAVGLQFAATAATTWLTLHLFDHRPFHSVGLDVNPGRFRELAQGLSTGIVLVELTIVSEWSTGLVSFQRETPVSGS